MASLSLSIITPTRNSAATLPATLGSLRSLVAQGAEHIVVDSESTDGTAELARQSGATVLSYPPGNMYAAVNHGMRHASGQILTYINSDDVLYPDAVLRAMAARPAPDAIVYGNINLIDDTGRVLRYRRSPPTRWLRVAMSAYAAVPQQGALFSRRVFDSLEGFNARYQLSSDYDFFSRALWAGIPFWHYDAAPLAGFRQLSTQLSRTQAQEMAREGWGLCFANRRQLPPVLRPFVPALGLLMRSALRLK